VGLHHLRFRSLPARKPKTQQKKKKSRVGLSVTGCAAKRNPYGHLTSMKAPRGKGALEV
jgi:hypothetical protein